MVLMDAILFPLIPLLFYFIHRHITSIYHQLLERQGDYTFVRKPSDDHRDWIVTRVFWVSKNIIIIHAHNDYVGQYFYLFQDSMGINEQHQFSVLLR